MIFSTAKEFFVNSSLHGLRFIATDERHWTERLFWIVCVVLSWYASGLLILTSLDSFQTNAISFVVETTYKDWNTAFPSYTVCETANPERVVAAAINYWGNSSYDMNLEEVLNQYAYFKGTSYFIKEFCFKGDELNTKINCPKSDLLKYAEEIRAPCQEVFQQCFWRDEKFDCCKYFLPVNTEFGRCYTINNFQAQGSHRSSTWLDMASNQSTGPGSLRVELKTSATGYLTSQEEIPTLNTPEADTLVLEIGHHYHFWFSIKEIDNEKEVRDVSAEQRKCRFPEENDLDVYERYSYGACVVQCRKKLQLKYCGCSSHLTPNAKPSERCNLTSVICLNSKYTELAVLKNAWSNKVGTYCPCMASCSDMELNIIYKHNKKVGDDISSYELTMDQLPTQRFKRIVVRGKLDLVVSMGGTTALFVGASLLSFVELIYYFTMRLYGNYHSQSK